MGKHDKKSDSWMDALATILQFFGVLFGGLALLNLFAHTYPRDIKEGSFYLVIFGCLSWICFACSSALLERLDAIKRGLSMPLFWDLKKSLPLSILIVLLILMWLEVLPGSIVGY